MTSRFLESALPTQKVLVVMAWLWSGENVRRSFDFVDEFTLFPAWRAHTRAPCSHGMPPPKSSYQLLEADVQPQQEDSPA